MNKLFKYISLSFLVFLIVGFIINVEIKKNKIKELEGEINDIEKPYYNTKEEDNLQQKYFNYAGVGFSSFTNKKDFFGCGLKDSEIDLSVYCKTNESICEIEFIDVVCLTDYTQNIWNTTVISLNQINCSRYYTLEGNVIERIY